MAKKKKPKAKKAAEIMKELKTELGKQYSKGSNALGGGAEKGKNLLMKEEKDIEQYIKKNPFKAVGVAFMVGFLMGRIR